MNEASDLFLLLLNLSQMRSQGRIMQLFVESLDVIFAPLTFELSDHEPPGGRLQFLIATRTSSHGYLVPTAAEPLTDEKQTLLHNASQMLAVVLERLNLEQKLQTDKSAIEQLATERLHQLQATVDDLRLSQNASINLVEDLAMEITERKRAEEELKASNEELTRFNRCATDRELRMIELKREMNELLRQAGQPPRFPLNFDQAAAAAASPEPQGSPSNHCTK